METQGEEFSHRKNGSQTGGLSGGAAQALEGYTVRMALQELNPSHSPKRRRGRGEGLQAVHMAEAHRELEETVRH